MAKRSTNAYERALFDNSVERMINTTIRILEEIETKARGNLKELVNTNLQDWTELKPHVVRCWNEARDAAFVKHNNKPDELDVPKLVDDLNAVGLNVIVFDDEDCINPRAREAGWGVAFCRCAQCVAMRGK